VLFSFLPIQDCKSIPGFPGRGQAAGTGQIDPLQSCPYRALGHRDNRFNFDGIPLGNELTPTADRAWRPRSPNISTKRSEQPSNTSRAGSNMPCSPIQRRRARATSARSCGAAHRLFFERDLMMPEAEIRNERGHHLTLYPWASAGIAAVLTLAGTLILGIQSKSTEPLRRREVRSATLTDKAKSAACLRPG